jgi:hypothetical protein
MATNTLFQTNSNTSSKDNLPQPPQLQTMNSFLTGNDTNADASTAPTSLFSTIPTTQKKDISSIPPAFFIGKYENTLDLEESVEEARDQRNLSIGYGDRRLSGVLSEVKSACTSLL